VDDFLIRRDETAWSFIGITLWYKNKNKNKIITKKQKSRIMVVDAGPY